MVTDFLVGLMIERIRTVGLRHLSRYLAPKYCDQLLARLLPWSAALAGVLLFAGLYDGLLIAPPDYQQGNAYRIMFIHVPAAMCSLMVYVVMTGFVLLHWVWKIKIGEALAKVCAPIGAVFTVITLVSGSIWGRPTWGTYWIWDARLTAELIVLVIYIGIILLRAAIRVPELRARIAGVVTLIGCINIPIVHYSVDWWHTLHQGATLFRWGHPTIAGVMLQPLLIMLAAFICYFLAMLCLYGRIAIRQQARTSRWVMSKMDTVQDKLNECV